MPTEPGHRPHFSRIVSLVFFIGVASIVIEKRFLPALQKEANLKNAEPQRTATYLSGRRPAHMDLAEAEAAALSTGSKAARAKLGVANVDEPRDPVAEWERRVTAQFAGLKAWASRSRCLLKKGQIPSPLPGATPGREITAYIDPVRRRVWKATFPGECGFGQFGYYTPAGYLRRLRLSNRVFGDDVEFEGLWVRPGGLSLVTSQSFIQPHPVRFIPTQEEIVAFLNDLGFVLDESAMIWERDDGVQLADTHNRNFIIAPDGILRAIDVQPRLKAGFEFSAVRQPAYS
jgi:Serine/Threonine/Tyrosine Kinase found in polyvalent proteins